MLVIRKNYIFDDRLFNDNKLLVTFLDIKKAGHGSVTLISGRIVFIVNDKFFFCPAVLAKPFLLDSISEIPVLPVPDPASYSAPDPAAN
jgi:hypothetical protein